MFLKSIKVTSNTLTYTDPSTNYTYTYFAVRDQESTVVGVWNFQSAGAVNGDGGIDYLFFEPHGFAIMQTSFSGAQYLLLGYYSISNGSLSVTFFENMDPSQPSGDPLVFDSIATDGSVLQLLQQTNQGDQVFNGFRL
jgi:hypothetical protein